MATINYYIIIFMIKSTHYSKIFEPFACQAQHHTEKDESFQ